MFRIYNDLSGLCSRSKDVTLPCTKIHGKNVLWEECKLVWPLQKTIERFLKKLKTELPNDPTIPLQGIYPEKKTKRLIQKDTCIQCSQQHYL